MDASNNFTKKQIITLIIVPHIPLPFVTVWSQSRLIIRGFCSLSAFQLSCNIPSECIVVFLFFFFLSIPGWMESNDRAAANREHGHGLFSWPSPVQTAVLPLAPVSLELDPQLLRQTVWKWMILNLSTPSSKSKSQEKKEQFIYSQFHHDWIESKIYSQTENKKVKSVLCVCCFCSSIVWVCHPVGNMKAHLHLQ